MNIVELARYYRPGHSVFQIEYGITGRCGFTRYGMFRQTLRELIPRYEALLNIYTKRKDSGGEYPDHFTNCVLLETAKETVHFYKLALALYKELSPLSSARIEELELEMHEQKILFAAALDYITLQRIQRSTLEDALTLPLAIRKGVLEKIRGQEEIEKLVAWAESYDPKIPDISSIAIEDKTFLRLLNDSFNPEQYNQLIGSQDAHSSYLLDIGTDR